MPRPHAPELPPCYAMTLPGLEEVAAEEIVRDLHAEVKRTAPGLVVFRPSAVDGSLLRLRTVEDVFLLAWGTDQLTHRAEDLDRIQRWTARDADWSRLLQLHHAVRPKPKGKPTFRLVTQMSGEHVYRRVDAGKSLAKGLAGKLPASWRPAEENAAVEVWLTIDGSTAVCGLRLSDRTMRHRTWKREHRPASLRPTLAAAMVRLAGIGPAQVVADPMCGAGTLLAEVLESDRQRSRDRTQVATVLGGDLDAAALRAGAVNLRRLGQPFLARWDATRLPLAAGSVDRLLSNPPFGVQLGAPEEIGPLYHAMLAEYDRILKPGGRAVLLVADIPVLRAAARRRRWKPIREVRVRVLGQRATVAVWRKETGAAS
jgi:23S rRNA G2445 N2-methylase RlmL